MKAMIKFKHILNCFTRTKSKQNIRCFYLTKFYQSFKCIWTLQILFIKYKPDVVASFGRDVGRGATIKGNDRML